jgi:uroporphyrinogen decarboxylase
VSELLRACRREATAHTPIWLMRQAGRYQPEYRALRERLSFVDMCKRSDVAAQVTLSPVTQFGFDAAIVFADILLVLEPMGIGFEFVDDGPRIGAPLRTRAHVEAVEARIDASHSLAFVMETIRIVRAALPAEVPLIGFAGAPFTLASYAIEGGGSRDYAHTKRFMWEDPAAWNALMVKLGGAVADYLLAQVHAGAQVLQVFDSWIGCLGPADYRRFVEPHMRRLFAALRAGAPDVPVIHFGTGNPALYPLMREAGGDVIGIDWRSDLGAQWDALGEIAIMGNLDPTALLGPVDAMRERAQAVLDAARGRPGHIFNLGHGILPATPVDHVRALVEYVRDIRARARA